MTDQMTDVQPANKRRISPIAVTIVAVVVLVLAFLAAASVITELMWFEQLGYTSVLVTQWVAMGVMFLIGFFGMALPLFFAIDIAYRTRPVYARLTAQLDRYQEMVEPLRRFIKFALPAVIGIFAGIAAATGWERALLWLHSSPTGTVDPEFGLDISFYMFDLPLYQAAVGFASAVVLLSLIAGVATSYLYGGIAFSGRDVRISKSTRIQAAALAAVYLALQAASLWLDQYRTLTDSTGLFTGATYSGVHAEIPGKQILAGIAALVAILFIVTSVIGKWRISVIGTGLLLVAALVLSMGYPWVVQRFQVVPDERTIENPYLARNIEATRAAYGLDAVEVERYNAVTDAEPGALRNDAVTTANIRIIDPEIVSRTFGQLEQSRQYYQFSSSLSVDRYTLDGQVEDTVSGLREIDISSQNSWYNRTLVYTHGYGLVAAYGNQRSPSGEPVFLENNMPTSGELSPFEPRIYFGMHSPAYSIVGGERENDIEVDYPASDAESDESGESDRRNLYTFEGEGGPVINGIFEKLIFALKFQDMEILLSEAVVEGSQILFDRNPIDRVQKVAPYLTLDSSPYASVVDERVVWIIDGYTTSADYPYSELNDFNALIADADNPRTDPLPQPVNYIRNSVKATVDAYDGSVKLYAWDVEDPLLKAWGSIFPDTLRPISEMSGDLLSHVRYPADLFKVQREVLSLYHMTNADAFFSKEDAWRTPDDPVSGTNAAFQAPKQPAYYLTLAAGVNEDPNFSIYSTYIPVDSGEGSRDILTGYFAANSNAGSTDGVVSEDYGRLRLLTLPSGDTVPGPGQVQNRFTTDSEVSGLLNILRLGGSEVISGNLLTLPVGGGLLYVQPVYVQASSGTSFPILQKVLVSFGDDIAFEDTLDQALDVLFGGDSGASAGDGDVIPDPIDPIDPTDPAEPTDPGGSGGGDAASLQQALADMRQALTDRDEALQNGDWAAFGEADERLRDALERAVAAS